MNANEKVEWNASWPLLWSAQIDLSRFAVAGAHSQFLRRDYPFPFQPRMLKVEDQSDLDPGNSRLIQHLSAFMVRDAVNRFDIHDHPPLDHQIGNVFPDDLAFVEDAMPFPLRVFNAAPFPLSDTRLTPRALCGQAFSPKANYRKSFRSPPRNH